MVVAVTGSGSLNGLPIGRGSRYAVTSLAGLDDLPDQRTGDEPRDDRGDDTGNDVTGARTVELGLGLHGDSPTHLRQLVQALRAATMPNQLVGLYLYDSTRVVFGKVRRRSIPYDAQLLRRTGEALLQLYCPDPLVYDATLQVATVHLPVTTGTGIAPPLTPPFSSGAGSSAGSALCDNGGYSDMWPLLTIRAGAASLVNPAVENTTTGERIELTATMAAGDELVLDAANGLITLNGTASRLNWRRRLQWLHLAPGGNVVTFRADNVNATATLEIAWRSAEV